MSTQVGLIGGRARHRAQNDDQTIEMPVPLLAKSPTGARWLEGARWREPRQPLLKGKQTALFYNLLSSNSLAE